MTTERRNISYWVKVTATWEETVVESEWLRTSAAPDAKYADIERTKEKSKSETLFEAVGDSKPSIVELAKLVESPTQPSVVFEQTHDAHLDDDDDLPF